MNFDVQYADYDKKIVLKKKNKEYHIFLSADVYENVKNYINTCSQYSEPITKIHLDFTDSEGNSHYNCNQAVFPNLFFITGDPDKVTCKNCKRFLKKSGLIK